MFFDLLTAAVWLLFPVLFGVMGYATLVVPTMIEGMKAKGITQLSTTDKLLVDISDLCKFRWFIVFPLLLILAAGTTRSLAMLRDRNR